jgi:glycine dehydrogenase
MMEKFVNRHIGPNTAEIQTMLDVLQCASLDHLIDNTIPSPIRLPHPLKLTSPLSEHECLKHLKTTLSKNKYFKSYIGQGYYGTITPTVIQRNIFENPGWYTQYTPYQAEISQGRLEALLNFQTLVTELTAMPIANASLLDESTAAAEAMTLLFRSRPKNSTATTFLVDTHVFDQTKAVLQTRATPIGITLKEVDIQTAPLTDDVFGLLVQYPNATGELDIPTETIKNAKNSTIGIAVAADLLSLTQLMPPGEWGADVVIGTTQRFGVPLGFGGPHAAYFATTTELSRQLPGRLIGVSIDKYGKKALRMAMQTREQHIRKDKATSNICTAQALLAIIAGAYAIYHGPNGLLNIATQIHQHTQTLANALTQLGYTRHNNTFFDTLTLRTTHKEQQEIQNNMLAHQINLRYDNNGHMGISIDETTTENDIQDLIAVFKKISQKTAVQSTTPTEKDANGIPETLQRTTAYLTQPIFNTIHSETQLLRYLKSLEQKDLSLTHAMIPLGSCTMKLNATTEMMPLSWPEVAHIHPFTPLDQAQGYMRIIKELEQDLATLTGFSATSLQPNSGAQGEYAGLLTIKKYLDHHGESERTIALIPTSAHGTNPASAVMAGLTVIGIKCNKDGRIDLNDLQDKLDRYGPSVAVFMVTYPSTYGVYESGIRQICCMVHDAGAQVYMDGANMNAQIGLTTPHLIGADVCHLNLHKTFSIPHGGGGPGMGPICVAEHLKSFLPGYPDGAISATPWSSASILLISYAYIKMMGIDGLTQASKVAILNANYIKARLDNHYNCLFTGEKGTVAHELIIDSRPFKKTTKVTAEDIAKRLMDYGFHAPTLSWPVPETLMIEPTESEDLAEINRFCDALISIRQEIRDIENNVYPIDNNPLKNAPHTQYDSLEENWDHPYTRKTAFTPLPYVAENKFWPTVNRINQAHGDRNLVCTCGSVETYQLVSNTGVQGG